MRALFVDHAFPGNLGGYAACLAEAGGWEVDFLAARAGAEPRGNRVRLHAVKAREEVAGAVHPATRDFSFQVKGGRRALQAARKICPTPPDVVVTGCGRFSAMLFGSVWTTPIVSYVHTFHEGVRLEPGDARQEGAAFAATFSNAGRLLHLLQSERAFTMSRYQVQMVPREFRHKIRLLPRPVDRGVFRADAPWPARIPRPPEGVPLVTFLPVEPWWAPGAGFDCFLRAFRMIDREFPGVWVAVAGPEETPERRARFREILERAGLDAGRFVLVSDEAREPLAGVLARSAVCVASSLANPPGDGFFGAMGCGGPVLIASDTPPLREFVRHGQNGLSFGWGMVRELAWGMRAVLGDPAGHSGLAGAAGRFVAAHLDTAVLAPRVADFFGRSLDLAPDDFREGQSLIEEV